MKKILYILFMAVLFAGCSRFDEAVGPSNVQEVQKTWLKYYEPGLRVAEQITVCKVINGESGGIFTFNDKPNDLKVHGKLIVPSNAYSGDLEICILIDGETTFLTFSPPFNFNTPCLLDLTYKNVDLTGVDPNDLDFYYINDEGQLIPAEYENKIINVEKGLLKIEKVKIHHFSRYGWAK